MIKITLEQLEQLGACQEGKNWFVKKKLKSLKTIVSHLLKDGKESYARWLLARLLTHPQKVQWAIFSAECVIDIFESKYPTDKRPRLAIQAAKGFITGKIDRYAAYAAADAAHAAYAAAHAAYAAYAAAHAAYAAADAAHAAHAAAYAAHAPYAKKARTQTDIKIMNYALKLLGEI